MRWEGEKGMSGVFNNIRRNKKVLAVTLSAVFLAGWFFFAYYQYTNQILIIPITGEIVSFQPTVLELYMAKLDGNVKAVILDFNTPGGYADSALEIANYVQDLAKVKPVIAVMEDVCASGGYYIASFADYIFTHNNTVTGSIGVIATWVDMSQYYKQNGINMTVWKTGAEKDLGAGYRPPTKGEYDQINATVFDIFRILLTDIQRNRNLSQNTINILKTGATFSGSDAILLGLADKVGNIIDAIGEVAKRTGMLKFIIVSPGMNNVQRFLSTLF
ncbi:MAG: S49 family peptidase [Candidatus Bathyarchaeota archaeon]